MDEWEKIEYKPIPVRTLLVKMKNLSELMIDLAYSAALFHSRELAEDVLELEKRVDTLAYLLKMNTMIAARDAKDAESLLGASIVSSSADKISDAAADIAYIVLRDIGIHPLVREVFERVEEHLGRSQVNANSILVNKTLRELELASRIGTDVIAIRRGKDWIINPKGDQMILEGDVLIARGTPDGINELNALARGTVRKLED
ncbi:potassium channel protein [Candidatus Bathyarchaeota archaeon ex4484_231]|nr:MAG: potassium channel protein [Candidatus Bathyarchaeota archaeon ex4484_231]RJS76296.1 MAG: potassium channel protein [Candidatus Bathyarchaeota archaeon]